MAFMQCSCHSEVLGLAVSMNVVIPQPTASQIGMTGKVVAKEHPVLYLLHGLSDDHTIWMRRTSIERYAAPLGLAVVMPMVHRSFYTDMLHGYRYWTFISEELPELATSLFHLSTKREDTFVAGLSMGGYGAFKLALRKPEMFAAAASLSGVLDIALHVAALPGALKVPDYEYIFGRGAAIDRTPDDLFFLIENFSKGGSIPKLFQCCGTDDFLYQDNIRFRANALKAGFDLHYEEEEKAAHDWAYWDRQIEKVLQWLPIRKSRVDVPAG